MILNELANKVKKSRSSRAKDMRRKRTKNIAIGVGIGSALGVAAGILFAPKSGKETRQIIADKTSETVKDFKDNVSATKEKISASAAEKGSHLREAGQEGVAAAKGSLERLR
ncbi:MAG: YtxH domain-containing protein [Candidatus Electrothrix sp. Rat3]|nr:YtxH domain-containing protein [Candidatus Electrothrix rattekaaiensis]